MPGVVTSLARAGAIGFATHPYLRTYAVLVHVVHKTRILCSKIADRPPPSHRDGQSNCWFNISLINFKLSAANLQELVFLIGETDELLDCRRFAARRKMATPATVTIEDIMYGNVRRPWINGATHLDGSRAGLTDTDVIDLLYRDILGRPADPEGLSNYLTQIRLGVRALGDVRKSLLNSDEYVGRSKEASWAPGAIFSQPLALLAATVATEIDTGSAAIPERPDHTPDVPAEVPRTPEILEVALAIDSELFGSGWHTVEYLNERAFRWMESSGVIFSPEPQLPCLRITLQLAAVYGAHEPMIDCYFDDIAAEVLVEEKQEGFCVTISPLPADAKTYSKLRIESRVSGCPSHEDRGEDHRVLSLNVIGALIAFRTAGSAASLT